MTTADHQEQEITSALKKRLEERLSNADDLEKIRYILTETAAQIMDVQEANAELQYRQSKLSWAVERLLQDDEKQCL